MAILNRKKITQLLTIAGSIMLFNEAALAAQKPTKPAPWVGQAFDGRYCRGNTPNFGPYDYLVRNQLPNELGVVERYHFNADVENLIRGMTTTSALGDINYTFGAWPNHHRALYSTIRHRIRTWQKSPNSGSRTPSECYLQRAIHFSPKDPTAHMLYGLLLHKTGQNHKALQKYRTAAELDSTDIQIKYNLALLLVDLKQYQEATELAQYIYRLQYPLPGLREKLTDAGQWPTSSKP